MSTKNIFIFIRNIWDLNCKERINFTWPYNRLTDYLHNMGNNFTCQDFIFENKSTH